MSEPKKPKPLLDKDGNVVVNQFGHIVSARLTDEDKKAIDELVAKGYSRHAIANELGVSRRRVDTYINEPKAAKRAADFLLITEIPKRLTAQEQSMEKMVDLLTKMEQRLSVMQTQMKAMNMNTRRQKLGRAQVEREKRSQKQELTRLRRQLWRRTGQRDWDSE